MPLKIAGSSKYNEVRNAALKKREAYDKRFEMERGYVYSRIRVLAYPDMRIAKKIPGSEDEFVLKKYKEWLGKAYSRMTLYLSPISEKETDETEEDETDLAIKENELLDDFVNVPCEENKNSHVTNVSELSGEQTSFSSFVSIDFM